MTSAQPTPAARTLAAAGPATGPGGGPRKVQQIIEAPLSLRERKKLKTRQGLRREAYRLFGEQGYDATTVDQIAAAAEVSPSTFFRYFATKEDLVLTDEYDPAILAALRSRPADEPFMTTARKVLLVLLAEVYESDHDELLARMRLVNEVPGLRARLAVQTTQSRDLILGALTDRSGGEPTLEMRVAAAGLMAAVTEVILYWADTGGRDHLVDLMSRALDTLEHGLDI
ncbi:TetR family transcriptional regulator [Streptomyces sp. NPDC092296]|uniref:TetR family transcriptional regulator n=1 Tax=Streptomyces sp. NPDC092296 TaxID=3366012 RepID=UPI0037F8C15F